jgi:hypothetical protein
MKPKPAEKGTNRKLLKSTFDLIGSYNEILVPRSESFGPGASWVCCVSRYSIADLRGDDLRGVMQGQEGQ